jgi:hypothetical protein
MLPPTTPTETTERPAANAPVRPIALTPAEFLWLTLAVWLGGIFILTLMPYLLIPRVGGPLGIAGSYFIFFLAWQPVQSVTQRTLGMKVGFVRMIIFVAGAAAIASYLRQTLPSLTGC